MLVRVRQLAAAVVSVLAATVSCSGQDPQPGAGAQQQLPAPRAQKPSGPALDCREQLAALDLGLPRSLQVPSRGFELAGCRGPGRTPPGPPPPPSLLLVYVERGKEAPEDLHLLYAAGGFTVRLVAEEPVGLAVAESRNPSSGIEHLSVEGRPGVLAWRDERRWWRRSERPDAVATRIAWAVRQGLGPLMAELYGYIERGPALRAARDLARALNSAD